MYAVIYRQELAMWVDRETDVCCNTQTGVNSVGGQRDECVLQYVGVNSVGGQGDGCVL